WLVLPERWVGRRAVCLAVGRAGGAGVCPYTTLFRSGVGLQAGEGGAHRDRGRARAGRLGAGRAFAVGGGGAVVEVAVGDGAFARVDGDAQGRRALRQRAGGFGLEDRWVGRRARAVAG